jgi:hypothetical protein
MPKKNPSQESEQTRATIQANAEAALGRIRKMNQDAGLRELARKLEKKHVA